MTRFTVNGQPVHYRMDPETPLLWALRDASNLTGAKFGCGTGHCGACTVHIDGNAVRSCRVTIAQIEGSFVTTIEGLSRDRSHPVQQAFAGIAAPDGTVTESVPQCGYCIPGMIMAAAALVDRNDSPTDAQIDAAITNLCRCGVYPRVREAIRRAVRIKAGRERGAAAPPPGISPEDAAREVPALRPERRPPRGVPDRRQRP
jgi:isoquinoline 1-oxidoreductase alpha subunit